MMSVEDLLMPKAFRGYCIELERLQKNLLEQQVRYNASKDRVFLVAYLLAAQCQDFGHALRLINTPAVLASSSQQALLRGLLESAIRLMFLDQQGEGGLNSLWLEDLHDRGTRFNAAVKAWPGEFGKEPGPITLDGMEAKSRLEKTGAKRVRVKRAGVVEALLQNCNDLVAVKANAKLYSIYKELCPATHSDLIYLEQRSKNHANARQFTQTKTYNLASSYMEAVNASFINVASGELDPS